MLDDSLLQPSPLEYVEDFTTGDSVVFEGHCGQ